MLSLLVAHSCRFEGIEVLFRPLIHRRQHSSMNVPAEFCLVRTNKLSAHNGDAMRCVYNMHACVTVGGELPKSTTQTHGWSLYVHSSLFIMCFVHAKEKPC